MRQKDTVASHELLDRLVNSALYSARIFTQDDVDKGIISAGRFHDTSEEACVHIVPTNDRDNHKRAVAEIHVFNDAITIVCNEHFNEMIGMRYHKTAKFKEKWRLKYLFEFEHDVRLIQEIGQAIIDDGATGTSRNTDHKTENRRMEEASEMDNVSIKYPKNMILYGPPGTGKTYSTVIYAVAIAENRAWSDVEMEAMEDYAAVKKRYDELKKANRIEFTTFHQSYGYEDFIEGIKPLMSNEEEEPSLEYNVEDGVFKRFCELAEMPGKEQSRDYGFNEAPTVWKVSLKSTGDNPIRTECMENDHIRIGWDEYRTDNFDGFYKFGGKNQLNAFINMMRKGDIVLSCYSQSSIDAIGVVTGEYRIDNSFSEYRRVRDVKWIIKGINYDITKLNGGKNMVESTVYRMKIAPADVVSLIDELHGDTAGQNGAVSTNENYVFIIDEINRGNISKIFGELITLIEETKRKGHPEATEAKLPYSGDLFGVPSNVYILGTMNTADRSIALMDTALRRRFSFVEMMPDASLLDGIVVSDNGQSVDVSEMLRKINDRIEYLYDREHMIGHAFFMRLRKEPSLRCLADIFRNNVIPLLQEYFYDDYEKIQYVLGDNAKSSDDRFILDLTVDQNHLFKGDVDVDRPEKVYRIQDTAFERIESYAGII